MPPPHGQPRAALASRLVDLAPLLAVLMFLLAISAVFGYLHLLDTWHQQEALQQHVSQVRQVARDHLRQQREALVDLASAQARRGRDTSRLLQQAQHLLRAHPEILLIGWMDAAGHWQTSASQPGTLLPQAQALLQSAAAAPPPPDSADWPDGSYQVHTRAQGHATRPMVTLQIPIFEQQQLRGQLVAYYELDALLRRIIPPQASARYAVALVDDEGQVLAGRLLAPHTSWLRRLTHTTRPREVVAPLLPTRHGLTLRAQAWPTSSGMAGNAAFWLALALFGLTMVLLVANWLQARRSRQRLQALQRETHFRRAMEHSMRTGLRVLDMQGRLVYVNPAFCEMTGWTRDELLGQSAPFPFWPPEQHATLHRRLQNELRGATDRAGVQVSLRRKNGSLFEARLYVSPLVDRHDRQTGWMASMADITEPNRIRWQLLAARKRFTTVLEALGSSVSVASIGGVELLFANKLYRQWFGDSADGHLRMVLMGASLRHAPRGNDDAMDQVDALAGFPLESMLADAPDEHAEIYVERLSKWMEVRSRYLHWVDGRLVQIIIATDVTARHDAEERMAAQAKHAEAINRLVTMGELASSVAHEMNQPLTAISNYCTGAISRLDRNRMSPEELRDVLGKTAHQAQRAGEVIRHIRGFVKRSAPRRQASRPNQIVAQVMELMVPELRRRDIAFKEKLPHALPAVYADPVLIEQVLINLIRNGADAIDAAGRDERRIRLHVNRIPEHQPPAVCFAVSDTGTGLPESIRGQLYDPFFSTKTDGMGIGLSLCRSIIESHQGRISAQDLYNQAGQLVGCRFAFWLPTTDRSQSAIERQHNPAAAKPISP